MKSTFVRYLKYSLLFVPSLYRLAVRTYNALSSRPRNGYPTIVAHELLRTADVLTSSGWNMNYGNGLIHEKLEQRFAHYTGCEHAVAVNTGGMALQMILRALGLKPGDEILHQVDTCVATPYAVLNAGCTPLFSDIDATTLMLSKSDAVNAISKQTKVIMPVHMWGNAENMEMIEEFAHTHQLTVVEDACLSLGAMWGDRQVGTKGKAAAFSFGCLKPVQAGEGGMIVTNDTHLAQELRILRDWGETTKELGYRDQKHLAWNGRMSEFVAAIAIEQLKGYPQHLSVLRENVSLFADFVKKIPGLTLVHNKGKSVYTQVVLRIDTALFPIPKEKLVLLLKEHGIAVWHANFEPATSLSFFSTGEWKQWVLKGDVNFAEKNYARPYPNAYTLYQTTGIGISKHHFLNRKNVKLLLQTLEGLLLK